MSTSRVNEIRIFSAYSDESGTFTERFQAIAVVTGQETTLCSLSDQLQNILDKKQITEVKFALVRTHRPVVEAAKQFVTCMVKEFACSAQVRADILVWDTQDSRHAIQGRDDIANLERMYYKVLTYAARQWNEAEWSFFPDKNSQIDWNELTKFLNSARLSKDYMNLLTLFSISQADQSLQIKQTEPLDSQQEPLIQLADLLAGMARFTREEGENCINWLGSWGNKNQLKFEDIYCDASDEIIETKQNRFQLVGAFQELCKRYRLGVSLREKKCLWTPDPSNPINFWNYEPQHEFDQAPTRTNR